MMPGAKKEYVRLPGSGMARSGPFAFRVSHARCRLWLGADHLLQVESHGGYSESYRRFYFRDIQAIVLRNTNSWAIGNGILGALCGLFALWGALVRDPVGRGALLITTGFWAFFLLVNLLSGPTCECYLKTAVQLQELPSLRRRSRVRKVLARLRPLLQQSQGTLPPDQVAAQFASLLQRMSAHAASAAIPQISVGSTPSGKPYRSSVHQILFGLLMASACCDGLMIFFPSVWFIIVSMAASVCLTAAVVLSLVKQYETDLSVGVRRITWLAAIYTALSWLVGYIEMIVLSTNQGTRANQWEYVRDLAALDPMQTPWWLAVLSLNAFLSGTFGILGLVLLRGHWRGSRPSTVPPPAPPDAPPQP